MDNEENIDEKELKDSEAQPQEAQPQEAQPQEAQPQEAQTQDGGGELDSLKPIDYFAKYETKDAPRQGAQGGSVGAQSVGAPSQPSNSAGSGGVTVSSSTRLADDRSWERDWERMKQRRSAERAAAMAASSARQDLLADGRYFDDGRGNIKLKKQYRQMERYPGAARMLGKGGYKTIADDGGEARSYIRSAAERAAEEYERRLGAVISENRRDMGSRKMSEAAQGVRKADGNLAIYGGIVAALDNLRNGDASEDEFVKWGDRDTKEIEVALPGGGTQKRKVEAKFDYDAQGRVKGLAAEGKRTGMKIRSGYVSNGVLGVINSGLKDSGDSRRITGIIARQRVNPDFPDKAEGVRFYVQGVTLDPKSGKSEKFGRWMDAKGVYQMALKSGKDAGFGGQYSEDNLIDTWGDLFGVRAAKERAAHINAEAATLLENIKFKHKQTLQNDRLAAEAKQAEEGRRLKRELQKGDFEHKQTLQNDRLAAEAKQAEAKLRLEAAKLYMTKAGGSATDRNLLGSLPKAAWDTILKGKPLYEGEDGTVSTDPSSGEAATDGDGNPLTQPLTQQETMERIGEVLDFMKRSISQGSDMTPEEVNEFVNMLLNGNTEAPPTRAQPSGERQPQGQGYGLRNDGHPTPSQPERSVQDGSDGDLSRRVTKELVWGLPEVRQPERSVQDGSDGDLSRAERLAAIRAEMIRRRKAAWERALGAAR